MRNKKAKKPKKTFAYRVASLIRMFGGHPRPRTAAVILAAGNGTRCGADMPKQYRKIAGIPVLIRSVLAFEECPSIDDLIVVVRAEDREYVKALLAEYRLTKLRSIVAGGNTRQESALRGFSAIGKDARYIAIHDAARCLVTPKMITEVASAAYIWRAASAGTAVTDTIKRVNRAGFVLDTPKRAELYAAQTPQIFDVRLYRAAAYSALRDGADVTDDNSLCERIGQTVRMVECTDRNFKITTDADLICAEAILAAEQKVGDRE